MINIFSKGPRKPALTKVEGPGIRSYPQNAIWFLLSLLQVLEEIDKLCEQNEELRHPLTNVRYNQSPGNGMFNSVHTPIMKSLPSLYPSLAQPKTNLGHSAPSAPAEEPSPAYHNWAHGAMSPPSSDMKDAGVRAGSSESGESNSTSTEV